MTHDEDFEDSEDPSKSQSEGQLSPDVQESENGSGSEISSPLPNEGGIWGTRPQLDNMTHHKIAEIVQKTFGLLVDSLTPLFSTVQNSSETDDKYTTKKWTGTQPKVRQIWL
jgi:hypothetical protein